MNYHNIKREFNQLITTLDLKGFDSAFHAFRRFFGKNYRLEGYRKQVALCQRRNFQRRQIAGKDRKNPAGNGGAEEYGNIIDEDDRSNKHSSGLPEVRCSARTCAVSY
jgi:hypothetical protein